ncbi:MAG: CHAT domain-containing protein [Chromatiales bacterium]|nr:CHAT domain-containing protein [Chromatiales bacterium]
MKIFLSYASDHRPTAEDLCCRLQALGHEVFFDREDLPAGRSFDDYIRNAIEESDLFVFLISPESVADGRYSRTELKLASRKWPTPGWHVLPVELVSTPIEDVPAYLRSLTVMQAEGNLVAEVVIEVEDRARAQGQPAASAPVDAPPPESSGVRYRSVQLRFGGSGAGGYSISVPESPAGAGDPDAWSLDAPGLENALWANARQIEGSARRATGGVDVDALLPRPEDVREAGKALYSALFDSALGGRLADSLRTIDPQRGEGVRFVINTTDAPELARLPWEFLYSPAKDDFLFSDRMKPVVRWLDVDEPLPSLAAERPLRLLIAVAAPGDRPGLEVGEEIAHLDRALDELTASGAVRIERLQHATLESLDNALLKNRPHALHFIGHGDFSGDEGVLVLESDAVPGTSDVIAGRQLAMLLRNHLTSLRLVFLNSCMGATASRSDPFGGVAQSLIRRGIPAVVAMQFPIPDKAAVALSRHFYRYLASGQPVDAALNSARAFLYARGYEVEWGAPALHMRTPDGRLFDMAPATVEEDKTGPQRAAVAEKPQPPAGVIAAEPQAVAVSATRPPPGTTVSGAATAAKSSGRPGVWIGVAVAVLVAIAVGVTQFMGGARDVGEVPVTVSPVPDIEPEVEAPVIVVPGPDKELDEDVRLPVEVIDQGQLPTPVAPVAPTDVIDAAIAGLQRGETEVVIPELYELVETNPAALSAESLGGRHSDLAEALALAAEVKFNGGDYETGMELLGMLNAMGPFDPDIDALIIDRLGPYLETGAPAAAGPGEPALMYTVRQGDTLWGISRRLTGDPENWPVLLERNNAAYEIGVGETFIENPDRIYPGQRIFAPVSDGAGRSVLEYHVLRGESLWRIAERIYGDPLLWRQIYADNRATITDPDLIYPGQVLLLRPRADRR